MGMQIVKELGRKLSSSTYCALMLVLWTLLVNSSSYANDTIPTILEEDVPGGVAVCKWSDKELGPSELILEHRDLTLYLITKSLFFDGSPFVLFQVGDNGNVVHRWRICIWTRKIQDIPLSITPPYFEDKIPALRGLAATCPTQAPGPAVCKAALADALAMRNLAAIGYVRISDLPPDPPTKQKYWVPFRIVAQ